jgi:hypothetical protein
MLIKVKLLRRSSVLGLLAGLSFFIRLSLEKDRSPFQFFTIMDKKFEEQSRCLGKMIPGDLI